MKSKFNLYFVGELLKDAKPFDVARIKLAYNFSWFYLIGSTFALASIFTTQPHIAIVGIPGIWIFSFLILYFFKKNHLRNAVYTFFAMHLALGSFIFIGKHGAYTPLDAGMIIILITFAFLTLGRKFGFFVTVYYLIMSALAGIEAINPGVLFNHNVEPYFKREPLLLMVQPIILGAYILWVYMKAKEKAEVQIEEQKAQIQESHEEIQASIAYAQRIQGAILPSNKIIAQKLPESFVLYQPKDIVAGDFYWMQELDSKIHFAVADCTGHGVPGAMVSVVCNNALNRAVKEFNENLPGGILDKTRNIVIEEFEKSEEDVKDGMDIALCAVKYTDNSNEWSGATLEYAGAHNPLWIVRDGELLETKADKQPIGKFHKQSPFTTHKIELIKGDLIYLLTDGFPDQFGGPKGKKFKYKQLKNLLLEIRDMSMSKQKGKIETVLRQWKGDLEQVDDICIIGVRV